jgi:hypothetical protein
MNNISDLINDFLKEYEDLINERLDTICFNKLDLLLIFESFGKYVKGDKEGARSIL